MGDNRFEVTYKNGFILGKNDFTIIVDKETGVHYLIIKSGAGVGITPLLDEKGNVVIKK